MKANLMVVAVVSMGVAGGCVAQVWPQFENPMVHVMIAFDGSDLTVHTGMTPLAMIDYGDTHFAPASVLDGKYISSQYGFLADGFITLPEGGAVWIEMTAATPGIEAYEGGMRGMRQNHTYAPMFGTGGSPAAWKWGGTMHHPWFAAEELGSYSMTLSVYMGDALTGAPMDGYGSQSVTLNWTAVPAPASAGLLGVAGLAGLRRRREEGGMR